MSPCALNPHSLHPGSGTVPMAESGFGGDLYLRVGTENGKYSTLRILYVLKPAPSSDVAISAPDIISSQVDILPIQWR